jgi:hypothetical protein
MVVRCTLPVLAKRGALSMPLGKARRIRNANKVLLRIFAYSLHFAY